MLLRPTMNDERDEKEAKRLRDEVIKQTIPSLGLA
jgi:hypothetical protein